MMTSDQEATGSADVLLESQSPKSGSHIDPDEEIIDESTSNVEATAAPPTTDSAKHLLQEDTVSDLDDLARAAVQVELDDFARAAVEEPAGEVLHVELPAPAEAPVEPLAEPQLQQAAAASSSEFVNTGGSASAEACEVADVPRQSGENNQEHELHNAPELLADTSTISPECEQPLLQQNFTEESLIAVPSTDATPDHAVPEPISATAPSPRSISAEALREPPAAQATSLLEELPTSSRSAADSNWKVPGIVSSIDSTCATSSFSGATTGDQRMTAILKVSPPQPVGRVAGRFLVRLWRSCVTQPFGISFGHSRAGSVIVAEDAPHLGLRRGDEVITINAQPVMGVKQCKAILCGSRELDMHLYHRELAKGDEQGMCSGLIEYHEVPVCETCLNPPEPKCRAESWPLRDVLSTTGPVPIDGGSGVFGVQIVRTSRRQLFGLVIATSSTGPLLVESSSGATSSGIAAAAAARENSRGSADMLIESTMSRETTVDLSAHEMPAQDSVALAPQTSPPNSNPVTMRIKESLPQYGLLEGDVLLMINGNPANDVNACRDSLKNAMAISLEFRRPGQVGLVRRVEEPSLSGMGSNRGLAAEPENPNWFYGLSRRLGLRLCCMGQGYSPVWDDTSGADLTHDLDISKFPADESVVQPV